MSVPISVLNGIDTSIATRTRIVTEKHEFAEMANAWELLLKRSEISNVYLSYDWLYTWWLRFGEQSSNKLSIICVFLGDVLIAIAPFYIEKNNSYGFGNKRTLRLLGQNGSLSDTEQLDIIADNSFDYRDLAINSLARFIKTTRSFSDLLIGGVAHDSLIYKLIRKLPESSFSDSSIKKSVCSLPLPYSFEDFIANQTRSWRSSYRGHKKIMAMTGSIELRISNKPENIHAGLQSLAQIMCAQQRKLEHGKCSFDTESYMCFHEDICHLLSINADVEIISLIMEGRLLASACCYHNEDVVQVYQMAAVKGDGIHFSPMLIMIGEIVKQAIQKGKSKVDFHSNYSCLESEVVNTNSNTIYLHGLEWQKKSSRSYIIKSVRNLCNALSLQQVR